MKSYDKKITLQNHSNNIHCVKCVCIRSYSGTHFPALGLNMEKHGVSLCIQSECGKMLTKITPDTDTFNAVILVQTTYF